MGLKQAAIGGGLTLLSKMLLPQAWFLKNQETTEVIHGQFPADEVSRSVGGNWAQIQALNRQNAFLQFLNGKTETLSVRAQFYRRDFTDDDPSKKVKTLVSWTKMTRLHRRPPRLTFFLGDGLDVQMDVFLTGVSDIRYGKPNRLGGVRQVWFTLEFLQQPRTSDPFEIEITDTRYARASDSDYYELLAFHEYGDPMLGVVIRQRHPTQPVLKAGSIVKLPSLEGVRASVPAPESTPLRTAFGRKDTPQKRLRQEFFELRSASYRSHAK